MFEDIESWVRKNVKCCACGGSLETSRFINLVGLDKIATWKFPVFGRLDVPDYKPLAAAMICDECVQKREKVRFCIEWEESPCQEESPYKVRYHEVEDLEDSNRGEDQMKYYFGLKFKLRNLLLRAARGGYRN